MKKIFAFALLVISLSACGPHLYNTFSAGKDNASYIIVLTAGSAFDEVSLVVDGKSFKVDKVYKVKATRKAHPIIVTPGKHQIKVISKGETLLEENIMIGLQETKKIVLQ